MRLLSGFLSLTTLLLACSCLLLAGCSGSFSSTVAASSTDLPSNQTGFLKIDSPAALTSALSGVVLSGKCDPLKTVQLSGTGLANSGDYPCSQAGTFSIPVALSDGDGAKVVSVQQSGTSAVTRTFNRDSSLWSASSALRFAPPTLVNPIEIGTTAVAGRPGTGVYTAPIDTNWTGADFDPDSHQDVLIRGTNISNGGQRFNRSFRDGHNWVIMGGDFTPAVGRPGKINPNGFTGEFYLEGLRSDYSLGQENDLIYLNQGDSTLHPDFTAQACHFKGMHGTNRAHGTTIIPVVSISAAGLVTTSVPHGLRPGYLDRAIIAGTSLEEHNRNWDVVTTPTTTTFTIAGFSGMAVPTVASTGGQLWSSDPNAAGNHSDGFQIDDSSYIGAVRFDTVTMETSYDSIIMGRKPTSLTGNLSASFSRMNFRRNPIDPHDNGNINLYLSGSDQAGAYPASGHNSPHQNARVDNVWIDLWPGGGGLKAETGGGAVYPSPGTTYDGVAIGGVVGTIGAQPALRFPNISPNVQILGAFLLGAPPSDFAQWATPGANVPGQAYVNTVGYAEMFTPVPIKEITLSANAISASASAGTQIGFIGVPYPLRGYIIDVTLADTLSDRLALSGAKLVTGSHALSAGPLTFTLIATLQRDVRGVVVFPPITFRKQITLTVSP